MEALTLHEVHASAGARFGELAGREHVVAFGSLDAADLAARSGAALVDVSFRDSLRVSGEDRLAFLQGMLTQDVLALPDGASAYTALCTAKGALVADGALLRRQTDVILEVEPGAGRKVKAALERFLVADDAEISEASDAWAALELWGPLAAQVAHTALGVLAPRLARIEERDGILAVGAQLGPLSGIRLLMPRAELAKAWKALTAAGAKPAGFEARETWRVEAGVPRFGADMGEDTLPLEANLEGAISYTKGCYLGQEGVARATYRGHVNWKLAGVALGATTMPVGTELFRQGKGVGRLTSVARSVLRGDFIALARIHREATAPGTPLEANGRSVGVHALPFA